MEIIIPLLALIISVVLHELMHGVTGDKLGDPTPGMLGRLTLNPIKHLDPWMSVALPGLLVLIGSPIIFGAAKPVPINPINFKDPKKDMAIVALAGPLTNLTLAVLSAGVFKLLFQNQTFLNAFLTQGPQAISATTPLSILMLFLTSMVTINLILAFLNLIPIPPLDGSKILQAFLPEEIAASYERMAPYGIFIILALFLFPIGPLSLSNFLSYLLQASLRLLGLM